MRLWPWRRTEEVEPLIEFWGTVPVVRRPKERAPQDLRKAYGRASQTIHLLRCENALLREDAADARADAEHFDREAIAANQRAARFENALDDYRHRSAPDPRELGPRLKAEWMRPRSDEELEWDYDARWASIAQMAIDAVLGRPAVELDQHAPAGGPLTAAEAAELDAIADERLGGALDDRVHRELAAALEKAETADPADSAKVGDHLGLGWLRAQPPYCRLVLNDGQWSWCTRREGHGGQHVITNEGQVVAVWRTETSPGGGEGVGAGDSTAAPSGAPAPGDPTPLAKLADTHREQLACAIARLDLELSGSTWANMHDDLRGYYLSRADDVILAGWRPPLPAAAVDQTPVVAALLVAHELLADGVCRCGWGLFNADAFTPLWHAEHVAEQLLATGALPTITTITTTGDLL